MAPSSRSVTGAAGEYHVAAQLSQRGWLATVTIKNAPRTDVLAQHVETGQVIAIQTKTSSGGNVFRLTEANEKPSQQENEWFVFVQLQGPENRPCFFVVPHNHVAAMTFTGYRNWLRIPARDGGGHKKSPIRGLHRSALAGYEEKWDLLSLDASDVAYLGDRDLVERFGLPPGHPGLGSTV
jgi:hypothetical protein